jgi:hypothetical protein
MFGACCCEPVLALVLCAVKLVRDETVIGPLGMCTCAWHKFKGACCGLLCNKLCVLHRTVSRGQMLDCRLANDCG